MIKSSVCPVRSGQFTSSIFHDTHPRKVIAMTLPTYDRNGAARAGELLRSQIG